ncbi:hypothetical protein SAMN04487950_0532 [Halogranum rubrum]|uniref:ATPase n=1 Tax=Halogranum rubrum TaxID=553466 RepID=A0A1I4BI09_9EURY|nr:ATP-binding protein [Halogranum rubrum]SFK67659.1 hypothetical protein SAMN04487950_0532 [Halogranum rubrum]
MTFYDRADELAALQGEFEANQFGFVVVYGRRRVGKTELLKEFCSDRPHVYHLASQEAEQRQRQKFVEAIAAHCEERVPQIETWDEAFEYLGEKLATNQFVFVIDEFPYLVENNASIPSYLQSVVDQYGPNSQSLLVLCGSSISVMESEVLGHESPLYGRRTAQIDLQPFDFRTARSAISYELESSIESYAVTGGTPMYLTLFDYTQSLEDNIRQYVLSNTSVLYNEPEFLLRTELRNPGRYLSILEAIATGHTTPKEISGATGVDSGPLSQYLQTLRRLRFVTREVPVTASQKKSKRSLYHVADNFLSFWFRFIEPNRSSIEQAPKLVFEDVIRPSFTHHVARVFERICIEAVWEGIRTDRFDGRYSQVGRWWYGEEEIDIVGLNPNDNRLLLAECKWTTDPVGTALAENLLEKAHSVRWRTGDRHQEFALFSKSGFTDELHEQFGDEWHLFGLSELEAIL